MLTPRLKQTAIVAILVLLATWPMILSGNLSGRGAWDDLQFHWPVVQQFAQDLPAPDLSDYASATTPGYHLLLAPFVRAGANHTAAQLLASLWTVALFALLAWTIAPTMRARTPVILLPMLASMYVLFPGIWLLPDNAGWLGVLGVLLLALHPNPTRRTLFFGGSVLIALVMLRQVHIWAAAPLWLAGWLGSSAHPFAFNKPRIMRTVLVVVCTLPAFALLVWFVSSWGGLVPPRFQGHHQGPNPATPGFILLELAILSVFFVPVLLPKFLTLARIAPRWLVLAAAVGLIFAVVPESAYSVDAGRYSGWWNAINKLPHLANRSPIFIAGAIAGALALPCWLSMLNKRDLWIMLAALFAFTLAQTMNHTAWQRYHEPMLLIFIALTLARSPGALARSKRALWGSAALAGALGLLTVTTMLNAERYKWPGPTIETIPAPEPIPAP